MITVLFELSGELLRNLRLPDVVRDFYIRVVPPTIKEGISPPHPHTKNEDNKHSLKKKTSLER